MCCLERFCALNSNRRKPNVNFRLNLDEMCSLLTWGQFHSLHPPLFMGTLNLFQLSLSLRRLKSWISLCSRSVQTMFLSPSVVLQLQYLQERRLSESSLLVCEDGLLKKPLLIFTPGGSGNESFKCIVSLQIWGFTANRKVRRIKKVSF